jgi:catechol 2,3-dioxygenase-like lactoylglutathione lyase family enzyme
MHASSNVVGSLEDTVRFYSSVFGMEPTERPDVPGVRGSWFQAADAQIHLVDAPMQGSGIDPTGPHFCLGIADLNEAIAELEAKNIEYVRATQGPKEIVQIWVVDPAGNTIELQQDPDYKP